MRTSVPLRYRLLWTVLSPAILTHLFYSAYRRKGGWCYIRQRLGFGCQKPATAVAWLHAASVGEVNAAVPLLRLLIKQYPEITWLLTTNTPTGARSVQQMFSQRVVHAYLPLDNRWMIRRFLQCYQPRCGLIMETELWPNLYHCCKQNKIPLALVNARLSKKTLRMPRWLYKTAGYCLKQIDKILARGQQDAEGFLKLGADSEKLAVIGNIKYARANGEIKPCDIEFGRPYVLAASTHAGEEALLASVWKSLAISSHLLVIAPRYPERRQAVLQDLKQAGLKTAVHSQKEKIQPDTDVYLVDTLGELMGFMAEADIVFMGGSLVPRGGQNVLEPARLGKAIITGPHSFTFAEDIEALTKANAIICVSDSGELKNKIEELLQNREVLKKIGDNAKCFIDTRANIAERYLDEIKQLGWLEKENR